jgi:hypothetical protein
MTRMSKNFGSNDIREVLPMNAQSAPRRGGLLNSLSAQLSLLAIAVVILLVIAWRYIW